MKNRTKKLTFSAAIVALSVVIMYLGSLVEVLDLVTLFIVSLLLVFSVIEFGGGWPWMTYAATAILAILLVPNPFTKWEFVLIVGLLPMLKSYLEKLPRVIGTILKYAVFNLLFAVTLALFCFIFGMKFEDETVFKITIPAYVVPVALWALSNICFLCYDILVTKMVTLYYLKYRDRVRRALHL